MQNFITKPAVVIKRHSIDIPAGKVKLSSAEYEELLGIQEAWDSAQVLIEKAKAETLEIRARAHQQGLEEGREAAQKEALDQIAQMQSSMNSWVKNTDEQLIELVNRCVGQVVNQIDSTVLIRGAVEKGLSELINAPQIHVRVKEVTPELEQIVDEMIRRYGISGNVRILEDGTLQAGDVVVDSPMGIVDLRLDKQLAAINKVLKL